MTNAIENKHFFVCQAGLMVGDMILSVNREDMVGVDYDSATATLRKLEGIIDLWVANAVRTDTLGKGKGKLVHLKRVSYQQQTSLL